MNDLIYAEEYTKEMQQVILNVYQDAQFSDASDYIHQGRFDVEVSCDEDGWRLQMFLLGLYNFSFHMGLWREANPDEYIVLMRKAFEIKKEQGQS